MLVARRDEIVAFDGIIDFQANISRKPVNPLPTTGSI
jgi:hypothetical protein